MTERFDPTPVTLEALQLQARARGYAFEVARLTAILPELQQLRDLATRLRALPLDDEPPALRYRPE